MRINTEDEYQELLQRMRETAGRGTTLPVKGKTRNKLIESVASEEIEQCALARWLDEHFSGEWFHVPNGGHRNVIVGKKLKAQGVKRGVPDNFIIRPTKEAPGVVVELKRIRGGVVSDDQKKWLGTLSDFGWICRVCCGSNEAIRFVRETYDI